MDGISTSRRSFLKGTLSSASLIALSPMVPQFLLGASAQAAEARGETILVVVQLSGGNDGLNTVIPYGDDVYHRNRASLAVGRDRVRKITDYVGLHPSLEGFSKLLEEGRLGIIQGVGYPHPNRSHFSSMDIWHTARPELAAAGDGAFASGAGHRATGWLGRCLDTMGGHPGAPGGASVPARDGGDMPGIHLASNAGRLPLALVGEHPTVTSIQNLDAFKLDDGGDQRLSRALQRALDAPRGAPGAGDEDLITFLHHGTQAALRSSRQVQESLASYRTDVKYPDTSLARRLKTVAQLIDAGLNTRVYYLDLDGFDTHANQAGAHASLLSELSGAVTAFVQDLDRHDQGRRVMLMTFSEFGRRLHENASQGTDHGAAAPMFIAGGSVRSGLIGPHPSLTDLDEGDVKFSTDFRSVYAGVLQNWLNIPAEPVLGRTFPPLKVSV